MITVVAIYFLVRRYIIRKKLRELLLKDIDKGFGDATKNIVLSISKSKDLYKHLIKQTHPDKFQDDKKGIATELSKRITKSKRNYGELIKLQEEVENFKNS